MATNTYNSGVVPLDTLTAGAGVKVALTANRELPLEGYKVHGVLLQALAGNTGAVNVYRGTRLIHVIPPPTANFYPGFQISLTAAAAAIQINDLSIAPVVGGEGVLAVALVA